MRFGSAYVFWEWCGAVRLSHFKALRRVAVWCGFSLMPSGPRSNPVRRGADSISQQPHGARSILKVVESHRQKVKCTAVLYSRTYPLEHTEKKKHDFLLLAQNRWCRCAAVRCKQKNQAKTRSTIEVAHFRYFVSEIPGVLRPQIVGMSTILDFEKKTFCRLGQWDYVFAAMHLDFFTDVSFRVRYGAPQVRSLRKIRANLLS